MDWEKIKKEYPKAYNKFNKCFNGEPFETSDIYSFFDEQKIFIGIMRVGDYFFYSTSEEFSIGGFKSRTKAETAAFTKSFDLLEQQING